MNHKDYNDNNFLPIANQLLTDAVINSNHPFHQGYFATFNQDQIEQRTLVLRKWSLQRRSIVFHTDYRSPKISQLKLNKQSSVLFYSKQDKLQLRFSGFSHVHYKDRLSNARFKMLSNSQLKFYQTSIKPSQIQDNSWNTNSQHSDCQTDNPYENFAVIVFNFSKLDLLSLHYKKNTRFIYLWNKKNDLQVSFCTP